MRMHKRLIRNSSSGLRAERRTSSSLCVSVACRLCSRRDANSGLILTPKNSRDPSFIPTD